MDSTSPSLLERLRLPDQSQSWNRFVELYSPLLYHWAKRAGLQAADAADLVQDVLTSLLRRLPEFRYDRQKSFRAWLRTVTLNQWRDRLKRRATRPLATAEAALDGEATSGELERHIEAEYRASVLDRALKLMRDEFSDKTWKACWEHSIKGKPAAEVAAALGMTPAAVYIASSRVLAHVRQELQGLWE